MATVKPENQVDFRTQRSNKNQKVSDYQRQRRKDLEALGLCNQCGKEPVLNKKVCKTCTDRTLFYSERSVFRKYGVPIPTALMTPSELLGLAGGDVVI